MQTRESHWSISMAKTQTYSSGVYYYMFQFYYIKIILIIIGINIMWNCYYCFRIIIYSSSRSKYINNNQHSQTLAWSWIINSYN